MDAKCLACHGEIDWLRARARGLHGRSKNSACASCHPDHGGRDFALIAWEKGGAERFDHARAGWPLTGKHAALECAACHQQEDLRRSAALALAPATKWGGDGPRFIGLETECAACHEDVHRGALGGQCAACHETQSFAIEKFDHSRARFALTGAHQRVGCGECHARPELDLPHDSQGVPHPLFKPLKFAACSDCHRDPHEGRLGTVCSSCHGTESFRKIDRAGFDHDRTRYPLRGRHATVACARCHDPARGESAVRPAFGRCGDCHVDAHAGQATRGGRPADCSSCHDVQGFERATFTVNDHAATRYPLLGAHRRVSCGSCHARAGEPDAARRLGFARVAMRPASGECRDCHRDPHGSQLVPATSENSCATCHSLDAFRPSTFGLADHAKTGLPLSGAHADAPCASCHALHREGIPDPPGGRAGLGEARVILRPGVECTDCHRDPHRGRYRARDATPGRGCVDCHDTTRFRPSLVDADRHGKYGFVLAGAHEATPCFGCHGAAISRGQLERRSTRVSAGGPPVVLAEGRTRCEDCHVDPHAGQFDEGRGRVGCDSCHDVQTFDPASRFDHERGAEFSLGGAHANVPCARCHLRADLPGGENTVIYRGTPSACVSCHGAKAEPRGVVKAGSGIDSAETK